MHARARRFAVSAGVIFGAILSLGCRDDVTAVDTEDARDRDSALQQAVLMAHESTAVVEPALVVIDTTTPLPIPSVNREGVVPRMPPVVAQAVSPRPAAPIPQRAVASPRVTTPVTVRAVPAPTDDQPATERAETSRTLTVPSGVELALDAGRRICVNTNERGDRFTARLARSVTAGGTSIPRGARATIEITSLVGSLGEETIALAVRSIAVGGKTYSVGSRVTNIELDRTPGAYRCIPDDGRITARLTRPLRITNSG